MAADKVTVSKQIRAKPHTQVSQQLKSSHIFVIFGKPTRFVVLRKYEREKLRTKYLFFKLDNKKRDVRSVQELPMHPKA